MNDINSKIEPFFINSFDDTYNLTLDVGSYKQNIFDNRQPDCFIGNGYDWESLAITFIEEDNLGLDDINFNSEAGMFCAYSKNKENIIKFSLLFKSMCEDEIKMQGLVNISEEL